MIVRVRLFALAREKAGADCVEIEMPGGGTVGELKGALATRFPAIAAVTRLSMVAVNAQYAGDGLALNADDEIALIPPVSGG
jgi:molybdopterin converting factor subunit 1